MPCRGHRAAAIRVTAGYWIVSRMFRHEGACQSWMPSLLIWVAAGTIIGARLGQPFAAEREHKAPWKRGGMAEYLGVEEVAEPDETSHKGYGRHQTVECPQRGLVGCVSRPLFLL